MKFSCYKSKDCNKRYDIIDIVNELKLDVYELIDLVRLHNFEYYMTH